MSPLKIFIAGIGHKTSINDIITLFSQFGGCIKIDSRSISTQSGHQSTSTISQGYCIIKVTDSIVYDTIINTGQLQLHGRSLMCSPYLSGTQLFRSNANKNKRRIILKRVSASICELDVRCLIEDQFGPVDNMFAFKSEKSVRGRCRYLRNYLTYSIMFADLQSADKAVFKGWLELPGGAFAVIHKFSTLKKGQAIKKADSKTSKGEEVCARMKSHVFNSEYHLRKTLPDYESLYTTNKTDFRNPRVARSVSPSFKRSTNDLKSTRRTASTGRIYISGGFTGYQFKQLIANECRSVKPTSKLYRKLREHDSEYLSAFEFKNSWWNKNNCCFNQVEQPQSRMVETVPNLHEQNSDVSLNVNK